MGAGSSSAPREDLATPLAYPVSQRPQFFNFDAQAVRVVGTPEAPHFVAKDVCDALGYSKYRDAIALLEDDERVSSKVDTLGGPQEMSCVNESGLYALIFGSRKPQARLFRRWVTGTVLPAIRQTGSFAAPSPEPRALPLPPPATAETHVADIYRATVPSHRLTVLVPPGDLARYATYNGSFMSIIREATDAVQVSRFLRFLQGRGYLNRWVRQADGTLIYCESMGRNRHRRYFITIRPVEEVAS
jgi:prophage antirepressor-like protein